MGMIERVPLISRVPQNEFWVTHGDQIGGVFKGHADNIHWFTNPAIDRFLSIMTAKETDLIPYREAARRSSDMLFLAASSQLSTVVTAVNTPWGSVPGVDFAANPLFISILRGARPLESCVERFYPNSPIVQISASRDKTDPTVAHLNNTTTKFPKPGDWHNVIIDQTFATGGTLFAATDSLTEHQLISPDGDMVRNLTVICTFSSVPGMQRLFDRFPHVQLYTCRIIFKLDSKCYMVGGPGDAGLRCTYSIADLIKMGYY